MDTFGRLHHVVSSSLIRCGDSNEQRRVQKAFIGLFCRWPSALRNKLYSLAGIRFNDADIRYNVFITNPGLLKLGNHCLINSNVSFIFGGSRELIEIGDNVFIGPNTLFTTVTHDIGTSNQRAGENEYLPIHVHDGVWIGANCTILPGVTIGKGAVVGAGALVNKDAPQDSLVGGVPARVIRMLDV